MAYPNVSTADLRDLHTAYFHNFTYFDDPVLENPVGNGNGTGPSNSRDSTNLIIAICITALYSMICVVGLVGNILVMYGVVR